MSLDTFLALTIVGYLFLRLFIRIVVKVKYDI